MALLKLVPFHKVDSPADLMDKAAQAVRYIGSSVQVVRPARTEKAERHLLGTLTSPGRTHVIACKGGKAALVWFEDYPEVEALMLRVVANLARYGPGPPMEALAATSRRIADHRELLKRLLDLGTTWRWQTGPERQSIYVTLCAYMADGIDGGYSHALLDMSRMGLAAEQRGYIGIGEDAAKQELARWGREGWT